MGHQDRRATAGTKVLEMSSGIHCHPHRPSERLQQRTAGPTSRDSPDPVRWIASPCQAEVATDQPEAEGAIRLVAAMVQEEATAVQEVLLRQVALGEVGILVKDVEDMVPVAEAASEWAA
jgi:hypothetical protein